MTGITHQMPSPAADRIRNLQETALKTYSLTAVAVTLIAASAWPLAGAAQSGAANYPDKAVEVLVGYQLGGPTDLTARVVANKLQAYLGQPFIIENRPGAGSNIASEQLAGAAPDGYTLMVAASQMTWNSVLYRHVKFDPVKSFAPVSKIMTAPAVLVVAPNLGVNSLAQLVAKAKAQPGRLSFASSGNGTTPHLGGELFKAQAGIDLILTFPHRGAGPGAQRRVGGQVDMSFQTALSAVPHIKDGKLKALAVTAEERLPQLPDVPTMKEAGVPGVDIASWTGSCPAGTPPDIIAKLNEAVRRALRSQTSDACSKSRPPPSSVAPRKTSRARSATRSTAAEPSPRQPT